MNSISIKATCYTGLLPDRYDFTCYKIEMEQDIPARVGEYSDAYDTRLFGPQPGNLLHLAR